MDDRSKAGFSSTGPMWNNYVLESCREFGPCKHRSIPLLYCSRVLYFVAFECAWIHRLAPASSREKTIRKHTKLSLSSPFDPLPQCYV